MLVTLIYIINYINISYICYYLSYIIIYVVYVLYSLFDNDIYFSIWSKSISYCTSFSSLIINHLTNTDNIVDAVLMTDIFRVKFITDFEILQAVAKLKGNFAMGLDGLPSFLVKNCTPFFLGFL